MSGEAKPLRVQSGGSADNSFRTVLKVRDFEPFYSDEPVSLGGADTGPNPVEYILASLNGCLAVMIGLIAKEQDFRYEGIDFDSEGEVDLRGLLGEAPVKRHFQTVDLVVQLKTDESPERVAHLQETVQDRCPVYNLLKDAGVELRSRWEAVPPGSASGREAS